MEDLENMNIDYLDDDMVIDYGSLDEDDDNDTDNDANGIDIDYTDDDEVIDLDEDDIEESDGIEESDDDTDESDGIDDYTEEPDDDIDESDDSSIIDQIDYTDEDEIIDLSEDTDSIEGSYEEQDSDEQDSDDSDDSEEGQDIADDYGVTVSLEDSGLNDNDSFDVILSGENTFMDTNGDIVVQDRDDNGERFELKYIDIANIAVTNRIRSNKNVDSLVQSIKSTGLLQPLTVAPLATDGLYVLIAGFRRILACAKAGIKSIPCIVNKKINVPDVPILEALYNHNCNYTMKEIVDYINYLEKEKGISSASMIEYLLQMDSGDYTKLKDVLNDNDDDIVSALMNGQLTIAQAFKKLEQRRKKESKEEKELKKAEQVYGDAEESGADKLAGSGEEADEDVALTDDEIAELSISADDLNNVDDKSLDEMVEEGKNMEGFEPNKQDYKNREILDPALRKAVLARDNNTCQCCGLTGQEYTEVFDIHHKVEVYLGGTDDIDNLLTTCIICHKMIHLYSRGELHIRPNDELTPEEQKKFKRVILLGMKIREGMAMKHMKKEELKKVDKAETIGRTKPGTPRQLAT